MGGLWLGCQLGRSVGWYIASGSASQISDRAFKTRHPLPTCDIHVHSPSIAATKTPQQLLPLFSILALAIPYTVVLVVYVSLAHTNSY